jgi:hypothetical protein
MIGLVPGMRSQLRRFNARCEAFRDEGQGQFLSGSGNTRQGRDRVLVVQLGFDRDGVCAHARPRQ